MRLSFKQFKNSLLVCLAALSAELPVWAGVEHDLQLWTPITLDIPVKKRFRAYLEVNPRMGDGVSGLSQLLIRPALQFNLNKHTSLFGGYTWLTTYNDTVLHEHRIWEQILFTRERQRLALINRTRLEQRIFTHLPQTGNRVRHLVKLNCDLNKRLYLTASDELFINLNTVENGPQAGIDQNRMFAGLGIKTVKRSRVEIGYQYQYINRRDQFDDQANHAIVIQSFVGILD